MTTQPAPPRIVERAGALIIGGELLSGKVREDNLLPLARALLPLGIRLSRVALVGDDEDAIADELIRLRQVCDVVFTSGGVGPTHDDVSVSGVARALGRRVVQHPGLVALLQSVYGPELSETHLLMARVPEGALLCGLPDTRWPTVVCDDVWMFPGVPDLFRMKLPVLRTHLRGRSQIFSEEVLSTADEVTLKERIDEVVLRFPNVEVGSYPKWFDPRFKTRVTFDSTEPEAVSLAAEHFRSLLGDLVVILVESSPPHSPG
jgi:molybdopterin-biosynthesis enzyme MoeA-like protein